MSTFLWVMAILGLIEVGGALGYLATGKIFERTPAGVIVNAITWAGLSMWAIYLIQEAA